MKRFTPTHAAAGAVSGAMTLRETTRLRRLASVWLGAAASVALGCTVIQIRGSDEQVRVERHFGLASIDFTATDAPVVATVRSLGLASSPLGVQAGWASQTLSVLPPACHVVLWVEDPAVLLQLRDELDAVHHICVAGPEQGGL